MKRKMIEYIEKDTARRIINSPRTKEQMLAMLEGSFTMALPKHHGRLIDADVLKNRAMYMNGDNVAIEGVEVVTVGMIDNAETIIPATKEDTIGKFVDALFFGESATKEGE